MEIEMNIAEENAFTQPLLHSSLTNIQRARQSSEFKGTGTLRDQEAGYKWRTLVRVSKFIFFLSFRKTILLIWPFSAFYPLLPWVRGSVVVFKGEGRLLIEVQENLKKKYPRSSPPMLIWILRFRYINGRVPPKLRKAQFIRLPPPDHLFPWRHWHFLSTKCFLVVKSKREKPSSLAAYSTQVDAG